MVNSVARLCPLLQPVSLFSLPNAPSLADLDWEENSTEAGKYSGPPAVIIDLSEVCSCVSMLCKSTIKDSVFQRKVNINSQCIFATCQGQSVFLLHPTLIRGVVSLSSIPVEGTERCAWCTKTALQVFYFNLFLLILLNSNLKLKSIYEVMILLSYVQYFCVMSLSSAGVVAQKSEVWFLDRSLYWHFLTSTFTSYYRLMITHLGLPEWQYSFTPYGPSPQAKVARKFNQKALSLLQEPLK